MASPDNAWALDARDGHEIWHYYWKTKGGTHTGNRGVGMWHNWVYLETPDNYLLCLDAKTGKERWRKEIASFDLQYFSSMSPIVIGNHLLVGTGDDMDEPGMLESYDPDTGDLQWRFYTVPMKKGDPGAETWANIDAAAHGGGNVWLRVPMIQRLTSISSEPATPRPLTHRKPGDPVTILHLFSARSECGHRKAGVVVPDLSARHP